MEVKVGVDSVLHEEPAVALEPVVAPGEKVLVLSAAESYATSRAIKRKLGHMLDAANLQHYVLAEPFVIMSARSMLADVAKISIFRNRSGIMSPPYTN